MIAFGVLALGLLFRWVLLQPPRYPRMPKVSIRLMGFLSGEGYSFARFAISNESRVFVEWNVDTRWERHGTSFVCVAAGNGGGSIAPGEATIWNCELPSNVVSWSGAIFVGEKKTAFDQAKEHLNTVLPERVRLPLRDLPTWLILSETIETSNSKHPLDN